MIYRGGWFTLLVTLIMTVTREREFTTFEAAKICGVFHTTVINWVNKGKLKARLTPGGHRRIRLDVLRAFMEKYDMPVPPDLLSRPKRVLVVEDNRAMQRFLTRALQGLPGVEVHACDNGLEALIGIGKESPDLVLLDIRIPQVDGFQVCRVLKAGEQTKDIRVIAVSGEVLGKDEEAFLDENVDAYFRKPLDAADLKGAAAELLGVEVRSPSETRR